MTKFIRVLIAIFFLSVGSVFAQTQPDSIQVIKKKFLLNNVVLTPKQLLEVVKVNPAAYTEMKAARTNLGVAIFLGAVSGYLIGYPIGIALGGGEANWALAGIGAGVFVVSIPFTSAYSKRAIKAVEIYNGSLKQVGYRKVDFSLHLTATGLGLKMTF